MSWEKKLVTVVTKAYPEHSTKYGCVACTAGITEAGEWIRLYPIDTRHFIGTAKISKFDVIEVECKHHEEKLRRRESHEIRRDSIKIISRSLTIPKPDWDARKKILLPVLNDSIETLESGFKETRQSLGLVRPKWLNDFIKTKDLEIHCGKSWSFTRTLYGENIPVVTPIEHIFKYNFQCHGCKSGKSHSMQCEDWELFESYRSWGPRYKDPDILWSKLKAKYYHEMLKKRDLYFVMGTDSQWGSWFIIGLFYPPKPNINAGARVECEAKPRKDKMALDMWIK